MFKLYTYSYYKNTLYCLPIFSLLNKSIRTLNNAMILLQTIVSFTTHTISRTANKKVSLEISAILQHIIQ